MNTLVEQDTRPTAFGTPYVQENPSEFRVSTSAYGDPKVFEAELEKIFYSTWIYLGHESEIANNGDFKSTWIGMQPVILVRDGDGNITALLNACTHRGGNLCREEKGNTRTFVCPYHGWAYKTSGELLAIPAAERYPDDFDTAKLAMVKVPRVAAYGGMIFGSFNAEVESLDDYLGDAKRHIDIWNARRAGGTYRAGTAHKYAYHGNWKFQSENVYDGYHAGFTHRSAFNTFRKFEGLFRNRHYGAVREDGATRGMRGGHGSLELNKPLDSGQIDPAIRQHYLDALERLNGKEMVDEILRNRHVLLFPSVIIMDFNIRVVQPRAFNRTEVYSYPMLIDGIPEEITAQRLNDVQTRVGTAGIVGADDIDVFNGNQTSLQALGAKWFTLSRGLGKEQILDNDQRVGGFSDETPQRAFWRQWDKLMSANSRGEGA